MNPLEIHLPTPGLRHHECRGVAALRFGEGAPRHWVAMASPAAQLLVVTRGCMTLSIEGLGQCEIEKEHMILIPPEYATHWHIRGITRTLLCPLDVSMGCCTKCTAELVLPHFPSLPYQLAVHPCGHGIDLMAKLTEIWVWCDIEATNPGSLDERKRDLLCLLCRQLGVPLCQPPQPWQKRLIEMIRSGEERAG